MKPGEVLEGISSSRPLVHFLTNYVTVNLVANVTLCCGALPVMAHSRQEVEEMSSVASALAINLGTLDSEGVEAMLLAGKSANERDTPVVLDPVGAGATSFRTRSVERILGDVNVAAICGNAGEIATIAGLDAEVRGVESIGGDAKRAVVEAARTTGATVAATGPTDYVSDGQRLFAIENGHVTMGRIVGSGCASTAVVASFAAAAGADAETVAGALAFFGCAGEDAAPLSDGPGTFEARLLDAVAALANDPSRLDGRIRIEEMEIA